MLNIEHLTNTAEQMVTTGKGILAIDESMETCQKRFDSVGVKCSEENRRAYREMLITCSDIEEYISGMILFDETLRQKTSAGVKFTKELKDKGILVGIKVDAGAKELAGYPGEKVTEGLDRLRERLAEYRELGASFAKWRAVIKIAKGMPSDICVKSNCHALARYAALCQEADIVPMVEPEILIDGDHDINDCYEVSTYVIRELFYALSEFGVSLEGIILKTSMVLPGMQSEESVTAEEVATYTVDAFLNSVPASLPGILFLSGGQSADASTQHLNLINQMFEGLPWTVSFSYGRAIQAPALEIWAKDPKKNVKKSSN